MHFSIMEICYKNSPIIAVYINDQQVVEQFLTAQYPSWPSIKPTDSFMVYYGALPISLLGMIFSYA